MADWDPSNPGDSDIVSQFPTNERAARAAVKTNFGVNHHSTDDADIGKHTVIDLLEQGSDPSTVAGEGKLYAKDISSRSELFWISDTGSAIQVTSGEAINGSVIGTGIDADNITAGTLPDGRFPATLPAASGANLTSLNASELDSGTVPDARFPATLPAASGANLTSLNASQLTSGTIPDGRFPATLPAASGANLTSLNASELDSGTIPDGRFPVTLPAASGANLTSLNASALASGTVPNARLGQRLQDVTSLAVTNGGFIVGDGSNFVLETGATARASMGANDAANLTTGELPDARLSSNVPLLNASNTFTGNLEISSTAALIRLVETDATADEGQWRIYAQADRLRVFTESDAGAQGEDALEILRSGNTVSAVNFNNGPVSITDSLAIGGGQTISDSDNIALLDVNNVFTSNQEIANSVPFLRLNETDATTDERSWRITATVDAFRIYTETNTGSVVEQAFRITRSGTSVADVEFPNGTLKYGGTEVGFREANSRDVSSAGNTAATDSGKTIRFTGNGFTFTLDSDPPEDAVVVLDNAGGGSVTISATTLIWAADGSTGNRTLADDGLATALHRGSGVWIINGGGLT